MKPLMLYRFLKAKYQCAKEGRDIEPRDLFSLKSLVCAGTDTASYKDALREAWGIDPLEIFAGTEVSIVGTETHSRNGMVFFRTPAFMNLSRKMKCINPWMIRPTSRLPS